MANDYKSSLHFYFVDYPTLKMDVEILSSVTECVFTNISFATSSIIKSYALGEESFTVNIPSLVSSPNCGYKPETVVESQLVLNKEIPAGINVEDYIKVDFTTNTINVLKTMNFLLKDKSISITITYTAMGISFEMIFVVNYISNGPSFAEIVTPKNITCTAADAGWSMKLPPILGD